MFKGLFLITGLAAVVLGSGLSKQDLEKCKKLLHPEFVYCCKVDLNKEKAHLQELLKDCQSLPDGKPGCERDVCVANKMGISQPDGKVDLTKLKALLVKDFEQYADIGEAVQMKCMNGKMSTYGYDEDCDMRKLVNCAGVQIMRHCPDWSNEGSCEGSKAIFEECEKIFPQ